MGLKMVFIRQIVRGQLQWSDVSVALRVLAIVRDLRNK
jgi:hypothetical protein